ncbi:MAG: nuclear transport factor 2 family protein [Rhodobacteraceae bacterium]|nr:MAG: nuclear transport factor 2 family protein [Paracoccaceae bacterium]
MDQQTDRLTEAKQLVERYLELSMIPDPVGASACLSADFELVFTGGRRFSGPAESAGFNAKRYAWVKKRFLRTDAALDAETGDVHVYNTGYLYGEWHDGTGFETNRYMDKFVVRDGKLIRTDVWNDSAEILLSKAGLAEAAL